MEYLQQHNVAGILDQLVKELAREQPADPSAWMSSKLSSFAPEPSLATGYRTHTCGELRMGHVGQTVTLAGWVQASRAKNDQCFIDIRDRYGITQCVVLNPKEGTEPGPEGDNKRAMYQLAKKCGREFVIRITGTVVERFAKNLDRPTGDVEVLPTSIVILGESKTPPFKIEDETDAGEQLRMQYRYLDIRRNPVKDALLLRNKITIAVRKALNGHGFCEIETPILIKSTPEGARDFVVPSREQPGKFYALPQSPQTFKQLLMVGGMDRYFQIARCFRDEGTVITQNRQPEFTQIDCEMSFVTQTDILQIFESMMRDLVRDVTGYVMPPLQLMRFDDALTNYGIDKPDLRYDMQLKYLTPLVQPCEQFPKFHTAESVVALVIEEGWGSKSKKDLDKFFDVKRLEMVDELCKLGDKKAIGTGLFWIKVISRANKTFESSLSKNFTDADFEKWAAHANAPDNSVLVLLSGPNQHMETQICMGKLRHQMGHELGYRSKGFSALWVIDFPLLEWDEEAQRCVAMHHPFTSPHADSVATFMTCNPLGDPSVLESIRANAYDMVMNGVEVGGGSIRITDPKVQARMFELLDMSPEESKSRFGFLMEAFENGAPPHGGLAFGLDRLCTLLGENIIPQQLDRPTLSIRDYMAFPKTKGGSDLMIKAPCEIADVQLKELALKVTVAPEALSSSSSGVVATGGAVSELKLAEIKKALDAIQAVEPPNPRGKPTDDQKAALKSHAEKREKYEATLSEDELAAAFAAGLYVRPTKGAKVDKKAAAAPVAEPVVAAAPSVQVAAELTKDDKKKDDKKKDAKDDKKKDAKDDKKKAAAEAKPATADADAAAEAKKLAKKIAAVEKEGGKKGVEIEGACDMGGLQFFCTQLDEPDGSLEYLKLGFNAMNAECDPAAEERKGGAGAVSKVVFSAGSKELLIICNVTEDKLTDTAGKNEGDAPMKAVNASDWVQHILNGFAKNFPGLKVSADSNDTFAIGSVPASEAKACFPIKMKDDAMQLAYAYLNANNCMPPDADSGSDVIFGDEGCMDDY